MSFFGPILTPEARDALRNYKYVSSNKSLLDKIMNPFWEYVITLFPVTIAPNLITLSGTIQFLGLMFVAQFFYPLKTCPPGYIWILYALSLFIYQTMDAIDGKQARRTKQSSPLGQLFDHGNDALMAPAIMYTLFQLLLNVNNWAFIIYYILSNFLVFSMNWRAKHEGHFDFGLISVTEGQFAGITFYIIAACFGCEIYFYEISGIYVKDIIMFLYGANSISTTIKEIMVVSKYYEQNPTKNDSTHYIEMFHLIVLSLAMIIWNFVGVFVLYPQTYSAFVAIVFSGLIHRLIVNDTAKMKTSIWTHLLDPCVLVIIGTIVEITLGIHLFGFSMKSGFIVYGSFIYSFGVWLYYVISVINEICDTLKIRCLVIPKVAG